MRVEFKVKDVLLAADRLAALDAPVLQRPMIDVVNDTAVATREKSLDVMLRRLNLERSYVEPKVEVNKAQNPVSPKATIVASGATLTNLERYMRSGGATLWEPTNWSNAVIRAGTWGKNPRKPGKHLRWKRRVGAPHLGVPVDYKQKSVRISIVKGKPVEFAKGAFFIRGKGNQPLVATRAKGDKKGKGKVNALIGPSTFQMFRAALTPEFLAQVEVALIKTVLEAAERAARNAIL